MSCHAQAKCIQISCERLYMYNLEMKMLHQIMHSLTVRSYPDFVYFAGLETNGSQWFFALYYLFWRVKICEH